MTDLSEPHSQIGPNDAQNQPGPSSGPSSSSNDQNSQSIDLSRGKRSEESELVSDLSITPADPTSPNPLISSISEPVVPQIRPSPTFPRPLGKGGPSSFGNGIRSSGPGTPSTPIPAGLQAKLAAMASRGARAPPSAPAGSLGGFSNAGLNGGPRALSNIGSPSGINSASDAFARINLNGPKQVRPPAGLSNSGKRPRPGLSLTTLMGSDRPPSSSGSGPVPPGAGGGVAGAGLAPGRRPPVGLGQPSRRPQPGGTPFSNFSAIVDPSGALNFSGKAVLHAKGVDFSNGASFAVNMSEFELDEELGRGNYGAVKKVLHKPTNVMMAMKEIRLELDDSKLKAIIMELDILHRAVAPEIVEFYGAFFVESCVYYCMEYMNAGSLEQLQRAGVPEDVLARITQSMVRGLKFLKDELQIMHRDVKPTNILVNRKGEVKLCDFGVSGQLERSLAKTNIGCQSYMAPERIQGESQNNLGTYTVSSDVWSLGLSLVELAMGRYPYPPETYSNVFAQLTAIVHEPPPQLPDGYSDVAGSFVELCLMKEPTKRGTYADLLEHAFLVQDRTREVDMVAWVESAVMARDAARKAARAAQAQAASGAANVGASMSALSSAAGSDVLIRAG